MHTCLPISVHLCVLACMFVCACVCVCMCIYLCVHTCMCLCMSVCRCTCCGICEVRGNLKYHRSPCSVFKVGCLVLCCVCRVSWPASFQRFSCLCPPSLELQILTTVSCWMWTLRAFWGFRLGRSHWQGKHFALQAISPSLKCFSTLKSLWSHVSFFYPMGIEPSCPCWLVIGNKALHLQISAARGCQSAKFVEHQSFFLPNTPHHPLPPLPTPQLPTPTYVLTLPPNSQPTLNTNLHSIPS